MLTFVLFLFIYSVVKRGHQKLPERLESAHCRSCGICKGIEICNIAFREAVLREPELILQPVGGRMVGLIAARRAL